MSDITLNSDLVELGVDEYAKPAKSKSKSKKAKEVEAPEVEEE